MRNCRNVLVSEKRSGDHYYFKNNNGHQNDKTRKELNKIFQSCGLKLETKCILKSADYLDITFDFKTGSYRSCKKPNNDTRYINAKSNHLPAILKQIPAAISKRISTNSSNKHLEMQHHTIATS